MADRRRVVCPVTEVLSFEEASAAYERMMSGQARFRVVSRHAAVHQLRFAIHRGTRNAT